GDQIKTACNTGAWTGNGITSTTAAANSSSLHRTGIGLGEASALGISNFLGQDVDATTLLLRHTYFGDSNLDGMVDSLDFDRLAVNFNMAGKFWHEGDFNYDGTVNALDFN